MKRLIRMIILSFFTLAVLIVASYAWFTNSQFVEPNISGYSVAAYFGGGDGSTSSPFKIKNQRHLYNLAWLQYLGYFNKKGSGIVENPNANTLTHYSFSIENDINMDGWHLPPIGTSYNPFIGSLDGNGHTISNLETTNDFEDFGTRHPGTVNEDNFGNKDTEQFENSNSCSVIGFIGSIGQTTNMNYAGLSITVPTFTNLVLNNNTVVTDLEQTLIGSVAGYVNGEVSDIGVVNNKLTFNKRTNPFEDYQKVSNYTVVGYAEDEYTTQKTKSSSFIYNPTYDYTIFNFKGMGDQTEWGGSMDMQKLYERTKAATNGGTQNPSYTDKEIRKPVDGKTYDRFDTSTYNVSLSNQTTNTYTKYYNSANANGAYLKDYVSNTSEAYQSITTLYKDVYVYSKNGETTGYKIHDENGNYLSYNKTSNTFVNSTNEANATIWLLDSNGLYTYNDAVYSEDIKYYLNGTTELLNNLSITPSTVWSWDDMNNTLKYTYQNVEYYLKCFNSTWTVKKLYCITDGTNYLGFDGTTIRNYTSQSINTAWDFKSDGTIVNTNNRYLRYNAGLQISQTSTTWINDNGALNYNGYYIQYTNSNWVADRPRNLYITQEIDGVTHYLTFDYNNGTPQVIDTTNSSNATIWNFSQNDGNPRGTISTTYNNQTYYIYNNNNSLTIRTTTQTWSNAGDGLYNNNYYIVYDGGWKLSNIRQFYIYQEVGNTKHYLSLNGANIVDQTTEANATKWTFSTFNSTNPSGRISSTNGNTTYYLYINNGLLSTTTTQNSGVQWNNNNGIYYNGSYIQYLNEKWISGYICSIYQEQIDGTKKYLCSNDGNNLFSDTNELTATNWVFSDYNSGNPQGIIYLVYEGQIKYIQYNNNSIRLNTSSTTWYNYGNHIADSSNHPLGINDWEKGYIIHTTGTTSYYLNAASATTLTRSTSRNNATIWYLNSNNNIYTYYNGEKITMYTDINSPYNNRYPAKLSPSSQSFICVKNGKYISLNSNNLTWRLYWYNNGWYFYTNQTTTFTWVESIELSLTSNKNKLSKTKLIKNTFETTNKINEIETIIKIERNEINTYHFISRKTVEPSIYNYIPINANVSSPYAVANNNTGYIMAGGYESESQTDIRISQFTQDKNVGWGIRGSFNNNEWDTNKIYTVGVNGVGVIKDSAGSTTGTVYDNTNNNNLLFKKLKASKETLKTTLNSSGSYVYGLHFMDAKISKNHLIQPATISINGDEKTNYQMPEDCIDFHLKTGGIINFFSGYYYASQNDTENPTRRNDAFFSLHEIIRDSNERIIQIRHILRIYEKDGQYIYYYVDDDNANETGYYLKDKDDNIIVKTASDITGWTLKFDYNWIEDPENYQNNNNNPIVWATHRTCVFYFEIPVHKGEYALGSVDGKNGTYLMYLDIGANAAMVDRTKISQVTENTTDKINYVNGIQILDANNVYTIPTSYEAGKTYYERTGTGIENDPYVYTKLTINSQADYNSHSSNIWVIDINASNSAVAYITTINSAGDVDIGRTNNIITIGSSLYSTYCGDNITLNCTMDISRVVTTINRLRLLDYNRNTKITYESDVEFVSVTSNNATTNSKTYSVFDTDEPNTIITSNTTADATIENSLYGLLTDDGETIYNAKTSVNGNAVPQFTNNVTMTYYGFTNSNIDTANHILDYKYEVNTYKQNVVPKTENSIGEVIVINIVEDNTAHTVTKTIDNQQMTVQLDKAYKVGGNTITITSTEATVVTVTLKNNTYTFIINNTTVNQGDTVNIPASQ